MSRSRRAAITALAVGAALAISASAAWLFASQWLVDESVHGPVILALADGTRSPAHAALTMLPAYHYVLALPVELLGIESAAGLRALAMLLSLTVLPAALWLLVRVQPGLPPEAQALRGVQVLVLPVLFPFVFLVYTDVPATALVLAALATWLAGRFGIATLLLVAAVALRTQNVLWLAAVLGLWTAGRVAAVEWAKPWARATGLGAPLALALLLLLFLGWVLANGGVAVGDADSHPLGIYFGNVWLAALLGAWLLLPAAWAWRAPLLESIRAHRWMAWLVGSLMALFILGFSASHPFNALAPEYFLRNAFLAWLQASALHRAVVAPLIGLAVLLSFHLVRDAQERVRWDLLVLLGTAIAMTIPSWLVEQRYLIPLFALANCLRPPLPTRTELVLLGWWALQSGLLVYLIGTHAAFL